MKFVAFEVVRNGHCLFLSFIFDKQRDRVALQPVTKKSVCGVGSLVSRCFTSSFTVSVTVVT